MRKVLLFLPVLLSLATMNSCMKQSGSHTPASDELSLSWRFLGNDVTDKGTSSAVFTLTNNSRNTLGGSGWAMYYSQQSGGIVDESINRPVSIKHINGDWYRLTPEEGFLLEPGETMEIGYDKPWWLLKETEAPLGPYFVFTDAEGNEQTPVPVDDYIIEPFPPLAKIFPDGSGIPLPDAAWEFSNNEMLSTLKAGLTNQVIPQPMSVKVLSGKVTLAEGLMIHHQEGLEKEANYLAGMLETAMGVKPMVMVSEHGGPNIITLARKHVEVNGKSENAYVLHAAEEAGISIRGSDRAGVFYGIQSLLAMLPVGVFRTPSGMIGLQAASIMDMPAFSYRGMHIDLARNFIDVETIKRLIRVMAFYKLNKLHLHLTEDEGWRLEIEEFPELTGVGAFRGHTEDSHDHLIPAYGSGPFPDPENTWGSGYLSREQFIDLLKFADDHHIEVIPEVNMPGHARAAIYAMEARYDRLMEEGKKEEAEKYRLIDPGDVSEYNSAQNFHDNVVCVCKDAPYLFYEVVVEDIMEMYREAGLQLTTMHAGGDEVPSGAWEGSPICQQFLEESTEYNSARSLQAYFSTRLVELLRSKGLVVAGWEEIAMRPLDEGGWVTNPELSGGPVLPYVWNSIYDNMDLGYRLANDGYPVILCNVNSFYFDLANNHHPAEPGLYWGGFVNSRTAFEFIPFDVFKSTHVHPDGRPVTPEEIKGMQQLKKEAGSNIVGLQAELWSETLKGRDMWESYYLPELIAFAERAWVGQAEWGNIEDDGRRKEAVNKAFNEFVNVVGQTELPRLDYLFGGYHYRLPAPGAILKDGQLYANNTFPGLTIRYTTDGSEPTADSKVYGGPVNATGEIRLRTFDSKGRGSRTSVITSAGR